MTERKNWRTNFFLSKGGRNIIDSCNPSQQQQPHKARRSSRMQPSLRLTVYDQSKNYCNPLPS
uniref:Uncharacterized protein n=1 Tax=Daphnia magna TaxID=35525 RepID=A0A0P6A0M9_9CRUS